MTCPAFHQFSTGKAGGKAGECRPVPPSIGDAGGAVWPRVHATDWCLMHPGNAHVLLNGFGE